MRSRSVAPVSIAGTMPTSKAGDVSDTLEDALAATGLSEARVRHKPGLLSDNGPVLHQW
ncbi:MAG: hypothetical protein ACI9J0_002140 [Cryomorphaceae bacterium]|jgi:hypothetical protein